jgi:hypothetical protein
MDPGGIPEDAGISEAARKGTIGVRNAF